ncbi:DsbA family protein [Parendozoicomonas haliclonae]|uniref:Disulfide bond formation protein D n=1 Tax=Parendozoicomonas haliclonae TaxID=1960125 RepID=A0A1X7AGW9_9GAMM|nr:thioredoxin domain-containing protein [Parendozoicomonas haliclonae]SMA41374.1 Disulfide bond formation protein D precursor [Parendozoicomonas haliclonae]
MTIKVLSALVAGLAVGAAATYFAVSPGMGTDQANGVLSMGGKVYTIEDLPPAAARALHDVDTQAWMQKRQILASTAGEIYVSNKVQETGGDRQTVLKETLGIDDLSDDELKAFYEQNRERIPAEFEQIKEQIRGYLMGQQVQMKREELVERLRTELDMQVTLPEPEAPLTVIDYEGFPVKGNPDAKVTIVKFADYQCPHCKDAAATLDVLMEEIGDKARMIYMDFPINQSGISRQVALGAVCADEQGKFWEYNDAAYQQQSSLNPDSPVQLADALALDKEAFQACMNSDRPETRVARAEDEAERLGLTGTPAVFVNGRVIQPQNLNEALKTAIKQAAGLN